MITDFILDIDLKTGFANPGIIRGDENQETGTICFRGEEPCPLKFESDGISRFVTGDPVFQYNHGEKREDLLESFTPQSIRNFGGNFYIVEINVIRSRIRVFTSMFNILPVYYYTNGTRIVAASRVDMIIRRVNSNLSINKRYLLEKLLFGYTLFGHTQLKEVKLVDTNHFLEIGVNGCTEIRHTDINDYFSPKPVPWKRSISILGEHFRERALKYLPENFFMASLTGGLDSRSLVALSIGEGRNFGTYSYGETGSPDIQIPGRLSGKYGFPYTPFPLDQGYPGDGFEQLYLDSVKLGEGELRLSRIHYLMIARALAGKTEYILTGNFGSELFRSMRLAGNMVSGLAFSIFSSKTDNELIREINESPTIALLKMEMFRDEFDAMVEEIIDYRNSFDATLSAGQRFFSFQLNTVFRKYFGPEIIVEMPFVSNRTPYLDFGFIGRLIATELAGCNGIYMDNNPVRRIRGQALYPEIIRHAFPEMLNDRLDRGYRPSDITGIASVGRLTMQYAKRKILYPDRSRQPGYSDRVMEYLTAGNIMDPALTRYLNESLVSKLMHAGGWKQNYVTSVILVSMSDYFNYLMNDFSNVSFKE